MTVTAVSDENFEQEVLNSAEPVLVDFFAEWCGPCKAMAPALDQASEELAGKVKIVKVDVDKSPAIKDKYAIRGMPTLVVIKGGKVVRRHMGAIVQKTKLLEWIDSASAAADAPAEPHAEEFELANGLQVVVVPNPHATSVIIRTLYKVGAADDVAAANMLQLLMSQVPNKAQPAPGRALTDYTVFAQAISKGELPATLHNDAARMAKLSITDEDVSEAKQKRIEALARSRPDGELTQQMTAALHGAHAVEDGSEADKVSNLSRADLVRLHSRHFVPNNATVVVVGPVTADEVKRLAEETYGLIPAGAEVPARVRPQFTLVEPGQRFTATATDARINKGQLLRRYAVPSLAGAAAGEAEALEVLSQVLMTPGHLVRLAVGDGRPHVIARAFYVAASLGSGEFVFQAVVDDFDATAAALDKVIENVRVNALTEAELASAKARLAADHSSANYDEKATAQRYEALAIGVPIGRIEGRQAAIAKVTAEDVRTVAGKYLDPRRAVTGWLLPAAVEDGAALAEAV